MIRPLPLRFSAEALEQLDAIWLQSFVDFGELQAERYQEKVIAGIDTLAYFPAVGVIVPQFDGEVRVRLVQSHRVVYRVHTDRIEILSIEHTRQKPRRH